MKIPGGAFVATPRQVLSGSPRLRVRRDAAQDTYDATASRTARYLRVGEEKDTWRSNELVFKSQLCANHEPPLVRKRWTISEHMVAPSEAGALAVTSILYRIK